ncbi:MAG: extracellular solute-binding protein [Planctomycetes bacterium]|nr:extracellular solute-binding protein [Planctomycetota bacterium]
MLHPRNRTRLVRLVLAVLAAALPMAACGGERTESVVLYASLDEAYSRPLMDAFTAQTGIRVDFVTDSEATKTTGLVSRILGEQHRPRCDVFWNNEIVQTLVLRSRGCLERFQAEAARDIPDAWKDPDGYWVGFAARARVIILNTSLVTEPRPAGLGAYLEPRWKGKATLARPLHGTTATHVAVLWATWGPEKTKQFFHDLEGNEVRLSAGNAHVMREVAEGNVSWGFTDTDDFHVAHLDKKPVDIVFPDTDGAGTLLLPNTVCRIKGGPNPANALKLIEFILSRDVEAQLARGRSAQIPLRPGIPQPTGLKGLAAMRPMAVDWPRVAAVFEECHAWLRDYLAGK